MTDWKTLLSDLSEVVMSSNAFDETKLEFYGVPKLTEADRESRWLGFPPASEAQIAEAEARLGLKLPKSLRDFYLVSNGWRQISDSVYEIVRVENLNWIWEVDPKFCEIVEDSFDVPGLEESREENEIAVLRSVCLSQKGDATILLVDPEKKNEHGEWFVGAWASWHPGIEWSGVGFADFMKQTLEEGRTLLSETECEWGVNLDT